MPDAGYLVATIAVAAGITVALRAVPFAVVSSLRSSTLITYLGRHLPAGIMIILVVYLLRDTSVDQPLLGLRELVPVGVTAAVHVWRRQALLSIVTGTATYAVLLAVIPG